MLKMAETRVELKVEIQEVDVKKLLLLMSTFGKLPVSSLLSKLIDK